jgi:hypothetical protein
MASGQTLCRAGSESSRSGTPQEALTGHFAAPHFAAFGQDFNEGDLISMDTHRYIDPEIAGLY